MTFHWQHGKKEHNVIYHYDDYYDEDDDYDEDDEGYETEDEDEDEDDEGYETEDEDLEDDVTVSAAARRSSSSQPCSCT